MLWLRFDCVSISLLLPFFFSVQSKRPFYLFTNTQTEKEHRIQFTGSQNFAMEIKEVE